MGGDSHLTAAERDRIADLKAEGHTVRAIDQALGRSPATISRELRRSALPSGGLSPRYRRRLVFAQAPAAGGA